jgi:hypothetical protein
MPLDDGYMWDDLLFWGSPKVDSFGFHYDGEVSLGDESADEDMVPARTASGITISLPGVDFINQKAIITAYSSRNATMWTGSVGQVSCTFLKHFVVDINFDEMMITLIEPDKFEYGGKGVAVPWRPMGFGPWCIPAAFELSDGRSVSLDLMMDLGYNTQLYISPAGPNRIVAPERSVPVSLGMNIQRVETRGRRGRIPVVNIGGYEVKEVIAGFINEEHADHASAEAMVGLGILSRFNLVFDYTRQRLFIEPNATFDDPYEYDMTGMVLRGGRGPYLEVELVHPGTAASDAGIKTGDRVTTINGRPAVDYEFTELTALFRQLGEVVTFTITNDDTEREVKLTLRRVI